MVYVPKPITLRQLIWDHFFGLSAFFDFSLFQVWSKFISDPIDQMMIISMYTFSIYSNTQFQIVHAKNWTMSLESFVGESTVEMHQNLLSKS